ncbi:putative dual specificity tyrosine-phosphorylation-regulated kinase 3 homolog isoform X3 [Phlebotomus argentipes]|uniref:putative dual specificity tyrosine-phosphorylation-regulated kinase 3 homolog isoform X3 n=1 Tax=Phlebotomus argentipes TaxID=94469 RepID=UPI0028935E6A|nr:putative dual specificity tyrosine-phosphorylation-regulated kinase 3 homolog isoform X3 [Phlebotomus argentipes]
MPKSDTEGLSTSMIHSGGESHSLMVKTRTRFYEHHPAYEELYKSTMSLLKVVNEGTHDEGGSAPLLPPIVRNNNTTSLNNNTSEEEAKDASGALELITKGEEKALLANPITTVANPQDVLMAYHHKLTPYERNEILNYKQIYFIGATAMKRPGVGGANNSDYDNDQGSYIHIPHDHVAYRYEVLKIIGKGSFGQVIDFGSSCYEEQRVYTYIQSRFYRAPEVIMGLRYTTAIDMWSLGCILVELYTGSALFAGEDEFDQLSCIMEMLGMPPEKMWEQSKKRSTYITSKGYPRYCRLSTNPDGTTKMIPGKTPRGKFRCLPESRSLKSALKGCDDPLFINFIRCCLEYDPIQRMKPWAALRHSWFRRRLPRPPDPDMVASASTLVSASMQEAQPAVYKKFASKQSPSGSTLSHTEAEGTM